MNLDAVSTRFDANPDLRLLDGDADRPPLLREDPGPARHAVQERSADGRRAGSGGGDADPHAGRDAVLARLQPAPERAAPASAPAAAEAPVAEGPRMAAAQFNDQSVWMLSRAADRQGLLAPRQGELNAGLAQALLQPGAAPPAPLRFAAQDVAALALASGAAEASVRALDADAAAAWLNGAGDPALQQDRLRSVLDLAHSAVHLAPPRPSAHEMKQELRALLGMPEKAFKKMSDAEIARKYDEVMAALQSGGNFKMKFGKYTVTFSVDGNGQITECRCKKRGLFGGLFSAIGNFFGKFGKALLTVCSFIPIPWISIPARIVTGVIAVVEGIKKGNVLQAVAGAAGAVVGGVGAIAGKAASGVAGTVAAVAGKVETMARGAQAAIASFQRGGFNGIVNGVLQAASTVAGAFGDVAGGIAEGAKSVQQWSERVLVGEKVVVDIKNGRIVDALQGGAGLAGDVAGALGAPTAVTSAIGQVQQAVRHGDAAVDTVSALLRGDVQGALGRGAALAQGLDADLGTRIAPQFDAGSGWVGAAGKWIGHGADAVGAIRELGAGRVDAALQSFAGLADGMRWDVALERIAAPAGLDRARWDAARADAAQTLRAWSGFIAEGRGIVDGVRAGDYDGAFSRALGLGNGVAASLGAGAPLDPDAGWAQRAQRLLGHAERARDAIAAAASGDVERALDRASDLAREAGIDFGLDDGHAAAVQAHLSAWAGFAGDGIRVATAVRAGDARAIAARSIDLAAGLGGYIDDADAHAAGTPPAWTGIARHRVGQLADAGLDARDAIRSGDVAATVDAARALYAAVKAAVEARDAAPAPLPKAA
ncbi:hypothetical protein LDO32_15955 [Luteimonas sp. Y-2-2-4F]|nr:hypothetical protein [Luteimonas sp. Y-2-2-4F]MCD9033220.1 hypothetical protein [Luteimonas sp. Y-2-2-4F]